MFANDSMFTVSSGVISPIEKNASSIRLLNEDLVFSFKKDKFDVEVVYEFYNPGVDIETKIGFPILINGVNSGIHRMEKEIELPITNFETYANNKPLAFEIKKNPIRIIEKPALKQRTDELWFISNIIFASESSTFIRVKYTSEYSSAGTGFRYANYLYGTGNTWKNGIEKLNLKMNINPDEFIIGVKSPLFMNGSFNKLHHWVDDVQQVFTFLT